MGKMRKQPEKKEIDMYLVNELVKFIENDSVTYEGIYQNVLTNLTKKDIQGINKSLFYKVCFKMILEASKKYSQISGIKISEINKQIREAAAKKIVQNMFDDGLIQNKKIEFLTEIGFYDATNIKDIKKEIKSLELLGYICSYDPSKDRIILNEIIKK